MKSARTDRFAFSCIDAERIKFPGQKIRTKIITVQVAGAVPRLCLLLKLLLVQAQPHTGHIRHQLRIKYIPLRAKKQFLLHYRTFTLSTCSGRIQFFRPLARSQIHTTMNTFCFHKGPFPSPYPNRAAAGLQQGQTGDGQQQNFYHIVQSIDTFISSVSSMQQIIYLN
ncbi:MAG: hypothetical protein J7M40_10665 [Planctomycetes bacterium]|nr:hypothetical protein [Planctomycetota bacterium]